LTTYQTEERYGKQQLAKKLLAIMQEVETVEKKGRNDFHKYDYAMEQDIVAAVRPKLIERGILILPEVRSVDLRPNQKGDATLTTLSTRYTLIDTETGAEIVLDWAGSGEDKGDKGLYKGMTGSQKYVLMKLFQMSTGDDPENDTHRKGPRSQQAATDLRAPQRTATSSAPAARPAATQQSDGLLTVVDITTKELTSKKTGKPFTKFVITFSDGVCAETIDRGNGKIAQEAQSSGSAVRYASHQDRFGEQLDAIEITGSPMLTDDDIPF
jgi:hypothetical protein